MSAVAIVCIPPSLSQGRTTFFFGASRSHAFPNADIELDLEQDRDRPVVDELDRHRAPNSPVATATPSSRKPSQKAS
jgi:hypothetical protein